MYQVNLFIFSWYADNNFFMCKFTSYVYLHNCTRVSRRIKQFFQVSSRHGRKKPLWNENLDFDATAALQTIQKVHNGLSPIEQFWKCHVRNFPSQMLLFVSDCPDHVNDHGSGKYFEDYWCCIDFFAISYQSIWNNYWFLKLSSKCRILNILLEKEKILICHGKNILVIFNNILF